jgi:tRNA G10  N-methylase Trm11
MQDQVNRLTAVRPIQTHVFQANATETTALRAGLQDAAIDVVFTDIPYGQHSQWEDIQASNPAWAMLDAILEFMSPKSILAITSDKMQKIAHEKYTRLDKFQLGKRQVVILKPLS